MKTIKTLFFFVSLIMLNACNSTSKLVNINDPYKNVTGQKLSQNILGTSVTIQSAIYETKTYSIDMDYSSEFKKNEIALINLDVKMQTPIQLNELDSALYLDLDGAITKLYLYDHKYKQIAVNSTVIVEKSANSNPSRVESAGYQLMMNKYRIPQNLWEPIANAKNIKYRLYLGDNSIDAKMDRGDIKKLKYFFSIALCLRDNDLTSK